MKTNPAKGLSTVEPKKDGGEDDWEAEGHLDTLMRAHKIQGDEALMERVRKVAGRKMKHMQSINSLADIKAAGKRLRQQAKMKKMGMPGDTDKDGM